KLKRAVSVLEMSSHGISVKKLRLCSAMNLLESLLPSAMKLLILKLAIEFSYIITRPVLLAGIAAEGFIQCAKPGSVRQYLQAGSPSFSWCRKQICALTHSN